MYRIIQTALELGFGYAPVALALFLSYRILDIADLSTDGGFVLGAAVSVSMAAAGHPVLGIILAMLCGAAVGCLTAELQTYFGIPSILAGIIVNTGLYTVNLMVMGWRSNVNLIKGESVFTLLQKAGLGKTSDIVILAAGAVLPALFLRFFLATRIGLSVRATGDNPVMVRASSIDPSKTIRIGLSISGSFTALSGALIGQYQKAVDINSGTGVVVIGLACLIIGETVLGKRTVPRSIIGAILGSVLYRFIYAFVLYTQIVPVQGLKLLTSLVVAAAIAAPVMKEKNALRRRMRKEGEKDA